ncbi:hypothetical protein [Aquisphaera insulae]|uniref:hypothetical protein n=1 Tax=Aquisphaera insulae TaxID=2712864 RepID=UPI0013EC327A|nr:hypothetical protein [Aquisphaera insulae]
MRPAGLARAALAIATLLVAGCGESERPIGGRSTVLNDKATLSNPLNVVGKGKPRLTDRRSPDSQRTGR